MHSSEITIKYSTVPSPPPSNFLMLPLCSQTLPLPWTWGNRWSVLHCPNGVEFSRMSYQFNHIVSSLLSLASFTYHNALETHSCCCVYEEFLFTAKQYSIVWTYHSWFIHSKVEGHSGCFQFWVSTNRAAINIHATGFCVIGCPFNWVSTCIIC